MISEKKSNLPSFFKVTTLFLAIFSSSSHAELLREQIYDDNLNTMLNQADSADLNLDKAKWMSPPLSAGDKGLVYRDNSNHTVLTGANLVVDYNSNIAPKFIIGGYSKTAEQVKDNFVTIVHANGSGDIYGGLSQYSVENDNQITSNGYSNTYLYVNPTKNPKNPIVKNNHVVIKNNAETISSNVYGGNAVIWIKTGNSYTTTSNGVPYATAAAASTTTMSANENTITIGNGNSVNGHIIGGLSKQSISTGKASASVLSISFAITSVDTSGEMNANENTITIGNNSDVNGDIMSGLVTLSISTGETSTTGSGRANASVSNTVNANQNSVSFDGNLKGSSTAIYGGKVVFAVETGEVIVNGVSQGNDAFTNTGSSVTATGNTVTIGEHAKFSNDSTQSLYGGHLELNATTEFKPETYDVFSGNTLNYAATTPATFNTVGNFENYNFTLTPSLANTGTALISAQDIILGADISNTNKASVTGTQSKVAVVGIHSGNILKADDRFILMESNNAFTGDGATGEISSNISQAQQGISLLYDVRTDIDTTNKQVTATIVSCNSGTNCTPTPSPSPSPARVNPQLKALSESYLANAMLVARGTDLMAYETISAINSQNQHNGWTPFATTSAQHNRYNSGSHVKSNDYLLSGGLSYQQDNITAAMILEGGWGSYDSYNSFSNAANVHGDGNSNYYGVGLLGKYEFSNGLYTEGSLRYGRAQVKFDTNDITNLATGQNAHYKLNTNYASAHIGVGYNMPINETNALDLSAKYLYTTVGGKDVNVAGDNMHFERVNSSRVRLDAELNHQYSSTVTLHAGVGYEYEFDGKAKATTYSVYKIDEPDLKGATGIVTLGLTAKPSQEDKLSFDTKLRGYTGKREGVGIDFRVNYAF